MPWEVSFSVLIASLEIPLKKLGQPQPDSYLDVLSNKLAPQHLHLNTPSLEILKAFVNTGNTVIVIEHNLDVIKTADWIVDMGPEGGVNGGEIIAEGKPEEVASHKDSYTGKYLKDLLNGNKLKKTA